MTGPDQIPEQINQVLHTYNTIHAAIQPGKKLKHLSESCTVSCNSQITAPGNGKHLDPKQKQGRGLVKRIDFPNLGDNEKGVLQPITSIYLTKIIPRADYGD
jgi:hypothetical protein